MFNNILAFLLSISTPLFTPSEKEEVIINADRYSHTPVCSTFNQYMLNKVYSEQSLSPVFEVEEELEGGCFGKLSLEGKWVKKEDKREDAPSTIQREWEVLTLLQGSGLVPEIKKEFDGTSLYIKHIPSNSLQQVVDEYCKGNVSDLVLTSILQQVKATLKEFYSKGWTHNDLHGGNLLVSYTGSDEYKVHIIDVAFSTSALAPATDDMLKGKYFGLGQRATISNDIYISWRTSY